MSRSYIMYGNIQNWTKEDVSEFSNKLENDENVVDYRFIRLENRKPLFLIDMDNDGTILKGEYFATKIANCLYCSDKQSLENKAKNLEYSRKGVCIDNNITLKGLHTSENPIHDVYSDIKRMSCNIQIMNTNRGYTISINHNRIFNENTESYFFFGTTSILEILS